MITLFLSTLLHHANRETKADQFYKIKDRILSKYGKVVGYDVQFIEGKICHSCNGNGVHKKVSWSGWVYDIQPCFRCWNGWYKQPTWVLLQRIQFHKYIFHKPVKRETGGKENPFKEVAGWNINEEVISGYIDHKRTKYGKDALVLLYLMYDWKGYWRRWRQYIGVGWYCHPSWVYKPRRWPNQIAHLIKYRWEAVPFMGLKRRFANRPPAEPSIDDLPF